MTPAELRQWRKRRSLSQGKAALLLGCGRRSLQNWERGVHDIPRYIELACWALEKGYG